MALNINASNTTNATTYYYGDYDKIHKLYSVYKGNQVFTSVVGSVINLWFLAAILSSPEVRSRLRNKIICNSFVLHLLNCAIILPATVDSFYGDQVRSCIYYAVIDNLNLMHELVSNWLLVMLMAVFIAQIDDFSPASRLSPRTAIFGTVVLLVFPWIASLVIVPVITHRYRMHESDSFKSCFTSPTDSLEVFRSIDTALPILLAILLLIVAALRRRQRFTHRNSTGSIQAELFGPGPEIDRTFPYVVAVIVSTLCDLLRLVLAVGRYSFGKYNVWQLVQIIFAAGVLSEYRAILMPITWLLLPDIRQRIKSWRPWHWPASSADLKVAYQKEGN
ncbi:hypothetical protein BsWGS_23452 [Bradybaena similaris]